MPKQTAAKKLQAPQVPEGPLYEVKEVTSMRLSTYWRTAEFRTVFANGEIRWEPYTSFVGGLNSLPIQKYKEAKKSRFETLMKSDRTEYWKRKEENEAARKEREIDEKYKAIMAKRAKDRKNFRIAARRAMGCSRMTKRRRWQKKVYSEVYETDEEETAENEHPEAEVVVKTEEE